MMREGCSLAASRAAAIASARQSSSATTMSVSTMPIAGLPALRRAWRSAPAISLALKAFERGSPVAEVTEQETVRTARREYEEKVNYEDRASARRFSSPRPVSMMRFCARFFMKPGMGMARSASRV
jgi:hypothetical protein